jgi:hypothetical protein
MPKLKLSIGDPTTTEGGMIGYARYRIDFTDVKIDDRYALGWTSPQYPKCEAVEYLERIKGWWTGWNREIRQEDTRIIIPFRVRLYLIGLREELGLLDEQVFKGLEYA